MKTGLSFILLTCLLLLFSSCGKKVDEPKSKTPPRYVDPQLTETELELSKQDLICGHDGKCPGFITKVAVLHEDKFKYCTGFLIQKDIVATASSCLTEKLRTPNEPCSEDVFFFFAGESAKPIRVGCQKVLEASALEGQRAFLWRSNVAYLQLPKKQIMPTITPTREEMNNKDKFVFWAVDQVDKHQGIIRKAQDCDVALHSYFNPLSDKKTSPVVTLGGCDFNIGNNGSPIMDQRGRVRGVLSSPVDPAEIVKVQSMRILDRTLQSLLHVSSYACAPLLTQEGVLDEEECQKDLTLFTHEARQKEMLDEDRLFENILHKLKQSLEDNNKYLRLEAELVPNASGYEVKISPKCFKNISDWIYGFRGKKPFTFSKPLPVMSVKRVMNSVGQVYVSEKVKKPLKTYFQFKPSLLRANQKADVLMWTTGPRSVFEDLSESCDLLL